MELEAEAREDRPGGLLIESWIGGARVSAARSLRSAFTTLTGGNCGSAAGRGLTSDWNALQPCPIFFFGNSAGATDHGSSKAEGGGGLAPQSSLAPNQAMVNPNH